MTDRTPRRSPAWLPALSGGLTRLSQSGVSFLVPLWALRIGATPAQIGVLAAVASLAPIFLSIPLGSANDRFGARRMMVVSMVATAASTVLYGWCRTFGWLIVVQFFAGIFRNAAWIGSQGYVTTASEGAAADRDLSFFGAMTNLGAPAGPLLAGWLSGRGSYPAAFAVMGVIAAGAGLCGYLLTEVIPEGARRRRGAGRTAPGAQGYLDAFRLLQQPGMRLVAACTFVRLFIVQIKSTFVPVFLKSIGYADVTIGLLSGLGSLASAGAVSLLPALTRRIARERLLPMVLGLSAVAIGCVPLAGAPLVVGGLLMVQGSGIGLSLPLLLGGVAAATRPEDRGLGAGLRSTINRGAQLLSPLGVGFIAGLASLPVAFAVGGGVMAVLACVALRYGSRLSRGGGKAATAATSG